MAEFDFDLFVIGGGSGGVRAARIAAGHGARVGLAEEYRFGGTCVIRGCVPKKLMVYASRYADAFEDAGGFGWSLEQPTFDWGTLISAKDKEIGRLEGLYRKGLETARVSLFEERAVLEGRNTLRLSSGRLVTADKILIATGGAPNVDEKLVGREHVITSNEAFHLDKLPERVVVVGGGYIAVEFAGIFAGLGADTTLVYRGEKILRGFDEDLRDAVSEAYAKRGIRLVLGQVFAKIERAGNGLVGQLDNGAHLEANQIMYAIGRSPNVKGLGLEALGIEQGWNGHIVVDGESRTNVDNIFAVGDVCDRFNLTPVAIREGHAFADTQFGSKPWRIDHQLIPTAVFSTPEIGTVGLSEHQASEHCKVLDIYKSSFRPMRATLSGRDEKMLMKLLVDGESDKIVGCHVVGDDAAEIVQMAAIAMRMGAKKEDFDRTMALHPSAAEELVTMRTKSETRLQAAR
ncbi:MAG: glutathione-disulfide reductase [Alphaproteobacteria bacterium]|nr:glutathione-disulfide reductase [Alphaproteobacteria bacterium]